MSDDKHTDSDQLTPEYLMALLEETQCEPVSMDILATMAIVKAQLLAAREAPCCGTITDVVKGYELFLGELLDQQPFEQYLLKAIKEGAFEYDSCYEDIYIYIYGFDEYSCDEDMDGVWRNFPRKRSNLSQR